MSLDAVTIAVIRQSFPGMVTEHQFHTERKWRFDLAWPETKIALEYEGGIFSNGRHTRAKGYDSDCEKYSTAAILGWTVIRITPMMLRDGRAIKLLEWAHGKRAA
jgi:very-short-patch-repair endonuclease